ncbi:MAG TPA: head GIN domain-containing protein [Chitinophagaceae bacterium]|nr:head GIN domain-containing protein [Chitinophagaceae bacterium]
MNRLTKWLLAFLLLPAFAGAQEKVTVNDKNAQVRNIGSSFTEISVSGSIDLYLSPDDKEVVVVSAKEEQYRDKIVTRVVGNKLEIFFNNKNFSIRSDMRLKAYVSFKQLNRITASGSSDVYVNGIVKSDKLEIHISGSSDFSGAVDVNELRLDQSGSSDTKLSGRAGLVDVDLSGASDMKAFDLNSDVCKAHASGSSDISVTVMKELYVNASGASDVHYKGTGTVREVKTSGSSSVKMVRD